MFPLGELMDTVGAQEQLLEHQGRRYTPVYRWHGVLALLVQGQRDAGVQQVIPKGN